jgi:hypothetical protein
LISALAKVASRDPLHTCAFFAASMTSRVNVPACSFLLPIGRRMPMPPPMPPEPPPAPTPTLGGFLRLVANLCGVSDRDSGLARQRAERHHG